MVEHGSQPSGARGACVCPLRAPRESQIDPRAAATAAAMAAATAAAATVAAVGGETGREGERRRETQRDGERRRDTESLSEGGIKRETITLTLS